MNKENQKENTEVANGKGVHQETSHLGVRRKETMDMGFERIDRIIEDTNSKFKESVDQCILAINQYQLNQQHTPIGYAPYTKKRKTPTPQEYYTFHSPTVHPPTPSLPIPTAAPPPTIHPPTSPIPTAAPPSTIYPPTLPIPTAKC